MMWTCSGWTHPSSKLSWTPQKLFFSNYCFCYCIKEQPPNLLIGESIQVCSYAIRCFTKLYWYSCFAYWGVNNTCCFAYWGDQSKYVRMQSAVLLNYSNYTGTVVSLIGAWTIHVALLIGGSIQVCSYAIRRFTKLHSCFAYWGVNNTCCFAYWGLNPSMHAIHRFTKLYSFA